MLLYLLRDLSILSMFKHEHPELKLTHGYTRSEKNWFEQIKTNLTETALHPGGKDTMVSSVHLVLSWPPYIKSWEHDNMLWPRDINSWERHINSWECDIMSWPRDVMLRELHIFVMYELCMPREILNLMHKQTYVTIATRDYQ